MDKKRVQSNLLLALTALIWGTAFVFQSKGADLMPAFAFNASRSIIAGIALLPVIFFADRARKKRGEPSTSATPADRRTILTGGIVIGTVLAGAAALQQIGIGYTSVGKAGFITAMYIVIVPILGIFLKKRPHFTVWISVAVAVVGMYLLCMTGSFTMEKGDLYVLACAFAYSIHILVIDHFSSRADCLKMSCIQFFTAGIISLAVSLCAETTDWSVLPEAIWPILYTGVMSSGMGYTMQMLAQRNTEPAIASLIMSLESVFSVLAGWVLLHQTLTPRELCGCVLMFAAILLAQTPDILAARAAKKKELA